MADQVEGKHTGEFLLSEGNGTISREVAALGGSEETFEPGEVVAFDGASLVKLSDLTSSDPQSVAGVLWEGGTSGDDAVYIARKAEVKGAALVFEGSELTDDNVADALADLGIIVR